MELGENYIFEFVRLWVTFIFKNFLNPGMWAQESILGTFQLGLGNYSNS